MPQTLLLADDSVTIQRVIELTFADEDIKVVAVSDGDQAIARIEADPPDIVLADIGMPGRTGYEVAQHIKQSPRLAHIPVVLLTGAFEPVDQAKAEEAGCDGVLAKPFEPQQVIARVKELLDRAAVERPVEAGADTLILPLRAVENGAQPRQESSVLTVPPVPPEPGGPRPPEVERLDQYFDRLDAAFATLSDAGPVELNAARPLAADIDWFDSSTAILSEPSPPDLPLSYDPPAARPAQGAELELAREPEPSREPEPQPAPSAAMTQPPGLPESPAPPAIEVPRLAQLPPLAEAFAALLAAEQHEPLPVTAFGWPTPPTSPPDGGAPSEELIEEIAHRVLDRLSDRVVRETVAGLVSEVAERLVREEIDRIKASIKSL